MKDTGISVKRRAGDRRDGTLVRDLDSMHFITPIIYPNRCDNEAYISEKIDLTAANRWLAAANSDSPEFPYTLFHLVAAALLKTLMLRPKLNRFIANRNVYMRKQISASFVVKKKFSDNGAEALAFIYAQPNDTAASIHEKIRAEICAGRSEKNDATTESMDMFNRMPRALSKALIRFVCVLDRHGKVPQSFIASDPYYSSVILSNLGSIKLGCGYHHLTNWDTNSVFCIIGEKKMSPFFSDDGRAEMRETVSLGLTIDERLADGYYYARSVALLKRLLENPELLELPFSEDVEH